VTKRTSDACLALASALITATTFQMPSWTGDRSSREWPIGAALVLVIAWGAVRRMDGLRTGMLLASLVGIGLGITVSSVIYNAALGKVPIPRLFPVIATLSCAVLYIRADKNERELAEYEANMEREVENEIEAFRAMPPEEATRAMEAGMAETARLIEEMERHTSSYMRTVSMLVAVCFVLTAVALPLSIWPRPRPVPIILSATILVLCASWFINLALDKWRERNDPE
jgi:cell division protein FtsL